MTPLRVSSLLCPLVLLVLSVAMPSVAQPAQCKAESTSIIEHRNQVTAQRVTFTDFSGKSPVSMSAHVSVPDSSVPVPGIAFSFAAIQKLNRCTELLPFAWALARAGAVSIVLDRAIEWEPLNDEANRTPSVMRCATQWLLSNVNLDKERLATAGPDLWRKGVDCAMTNSWCSHLWLNFGLTTGAESRNTEAMTTRAGQLQIARFAQRELGLSEVRPEWLNEKATSSDDEQSGRSGRTR